MWSPFQVSLCRFNSNMPQLQICYANSCLELSFFEKIYNYFSIRFLSNNFNFEMSLLFTNYLEFIISHEHILKFVNSNH